MIKPEILEQYHAGRDYRDKSFRAACYAPYVSMYFDTLGNVLACCQNMKFPLGSVATDALDDIWTGKRIRAMRKALRNDNFNAGCQFCEWQLSVGNTEQTFTRNFDYFALDSDEPVWPAMMEFSISNTCNLECVMCFGMFSSSIRARREHLPPLPKAYSDAFFAQLRKYLPHLQFAKFLGGEPFLAAESYRIWDMMIEDGLAFNCHVTTNGTQYNARVERVLEKIPFSIVVSMDGLTKKTVESVRVNARYETLMENFQRFHQYARDRKTYIGLTYCLMRQNWHEFGDYLLFADHWDCDVIVNLVREPDHCSLYTLPTSELAQIADRLERQAETLTPRLSRNRDVWLTHVGNIRRRVEHEAESSRAPFETPLTLVVVDTRSREEVPPDQRIDADKARARLADWSPESRSCEVRCDADDRIVELLAGDDFARLAAGDVVGKLFPQVVELLVARYGAMRRSEPQRSGHYVDRILEFTSDDGTLRALRMISIPTLNEFGLPSGSVGYVALADVRERDLWAHLEEGKTGLRFWSGHDELLTLELDADERIVAATGTLTSAAPDAAQAAGKTLAEWLAPWGPATKSEAWSCQVDRDDSLQEFEHDGQRIALRLLRWRRFEQGVYRGWHVLAAAAPIELAGIEKRRAVIEQRLNDWAPEGVQLSFATDAETRVVQATCSEPSLWDTSTMVGESLVAASQRRFGDLRQVAHARTAFEEDITLQGEDGSAQIWLRACTLPRWDDAGNVAGAQTIARVARFDSATAARLARQADERLREWSPTAALRTLELDSDGRIASVKGEAAHAVLACVGMLYTDYLAELFAGCGVTHSSRVEQRAGWRDETVEFFGRSPHTVIRSIRTPRLVSGQAGERVVEASVAADFSGLPVDEAAAVRQLAAWDQRARPWRLTIDSQGRITGMQGDFALDLGAPVVGMSLDEYFRVQQQHAVRREDWLWQVEPLVAQAEMQYHGSDRIATVRSIRIPSLDADGACVGHLLIESAVESRPESIEISEVEAWRRLSDEGLAADRLRLEVDHAGIVREAEASPRFAPRESWLGRSLEEVGAELTARFGPAAERIWRRRPDLLEVAKCYAGPEGALSLHAFLVPRFAADGACPGRVLCVGARLLTAAEATWTAAKASETLRDWANGAALLQLEFDGGGHAVAAVGASDLSSLAEYAGRTAFEVRDRWEAMWGPSQVAAWQEAPELSDLRWRYARLPGKVVRWLQFPQFDDAGQCTGAVALIALATESATRGSVKLGEADAGAITPRSDRSADEVRLRPPAHAFDRRPWEVRVDEASRALREWAPESGLLAIQLSAENQVLGVEIRDGEFPAADALRAARHAEDFLPLLRAAWGPEELIETRELADRIDSRMQFAGATRWIVRASTLRRRNALGILEGSLVLAAARQSP